MKAIVSILMMLSFAIGKVSAQNQVYNNIARYAVQGTPTHGVKIKTNIPFVSSSDMSTITLYGYAYGTKEPMNLQVSFYVYHLDNGTPSIYRPTVSSAGAYVPRILLASEGGKVVLFIDDKNYFHRFYVNAFSTHNASYYQGWTIVDEALAGGSTTTEVVYRNAFGGHVEFPGGLWGADGNVGIGTKAASGNLSVKGNIRAKEVRVEATNWPDYVFDESYKLSSLEELESFVSEHKHLPGIPSERTVAKEGIALGEMNRILLEKVEELTLHLIEQEKRIKELERR